MKKILKILTALTLTLTLTACSLPGLGKDNKSGGIVIAGGNTSERQILSEVEKQLLEHYMPEAKIQIINNLGSTTLVVQTFIKDICNMAGAMYTGTSITGELGLKPEKDPIKAMEIVQREYKKKYNMKWYNSYGFENTYAFLVRKDFAKKHNLTKVSDLKPMAKDLRAGVDTAWMTRKGDGYEDFKRIYGFDFKRVYPMEIGLVYEAVKNDEMDVVLGYSSDGRIQSNDLIALKDDLHVFPAYDVSPVASYPLLEKYPQIDTILKKLEGSIKNEDMQKMNMMSDEELIEPHEVARIFLEKNNYFENKKEVK